jgi:hypothetical protein
MLNGVAKKIKDRYGIEIKTYSDKVLTMTLSDLSRNINPVISVNSLFTYDISSPLSLLFITSISNHNQCLYIQSEKIEEVHLRFKEHVHQDTLFTGYMINGKFWVNDILVHCGKQALLTIQDRLSQCNYLLDHDYKHDPILSDLRVAILPHVSCKYLLSFWNYRTQMQMPIVGLRFIHGTQIYRIEINDDDMMPNVNVNVNENLNSHTRVLPTTSPIEFLVKSTSISDVYDLYLPHSNIKYDTAGIPDINTSIMMYEVFRSKKKQCYMMCCYNTTLKRWVPNRLT